MGKTRKRRFKNEGDRRVEYKPPKNSGQSLKLKDAVWQYLLDHSKPCAVGHRVMFSVRSRNDWDKRVRSRMNGVYREKEREADAEASKVIRTFNWHRQNTEKGQKKMTEFMSRKDLMSRFVLWMYKYSKKRIFG